MYVSATTSTLSRLLRPSTILAWYKSESIVVDFTLGIMSNPTLFCSHSSISPLTSKYFRHGRVAIVSHLCLSLVSLVPANFLTGLLKMDRYIYLSIDDPPKAQSILIITILLTIVVKGIIRFITLVIRLCIVITSRYFGCRIVDIMIAGARRTHRC